MKTAGTSRLLLCSCHGRRDSCSERRPHGSVPCISRLLRGVPAAPSKRHGARGSAQSAIYGSIRDILCLALLLPTLVLMLWVGGIPLRAATLQTSDLPQPIRQLYNSARYSEVVRELEGAIQANPKDATLSYWLGRCYYELGDFAQSIANFEHAISLDPNRSEFHDWLGKAWGRKAEETGRLGAFSALSTARKASHEFALAVNLDASNIEAQRDFIRYLMNAPGIAGGSEDRAQQQIAALEKVDPLEGALARAEFYATHKKFDQAGDEYQKILQMPAHRAGAALEAAEYYRDREDAPHMEQAINVAAKIAPSDPRLKYYRGVMLVLAHKDPQMAEKDLRGYLDAVPSSAEVPPLASAHTWLGRLYEEQGQQDKAIAEYQAALMLDPHEKTAHDNLKRLGKK